MKFQIFPLKGVNGITFGMAPNDVRQHFSTPPKTFKKTPQDTFPCDFFVPEGVFFYYDSGGSLEAVEFASPAQPIVENLALLGLGFREALAELSSRDSEIEKDADGAIAYQLGVSIYAPLAKDNSEAAVESVLAFRPGYYN